MPTEPPVKRTVAFIDAQNVFHSAKEAFGYRHPNFDSLKLAKFVRKEGLKVFLETLSHGVRRELKAHADLVF